MGSRFLLGCAWALIIASPGLAGAAPVFFTDSGVISDGVLLFQSALGDPNNLNATGTTSGRREINWDGAATPPTTATATAGTPFTGFLNTRGANFTTAPAATAFVQATPSGLGTLLGNATYGTTFPVFSIERIFTPIPSNETQVTFFIPGTNGGTPATVAGFGAVFSDVDLGTSSFLEFFDVSGNPLLAQPLFAPATPGGLSFAGVLFDAGERIGRVRIVTGTTALLSAPNDNPAGGVDLVVLDDLLFAEPQRVPGPAGLAVLGLAGVGLLLRRALTRRGRRSQPA